MYSISEDRKAPSLAVFEYCLKTLFYSLAFDPVWDDCDPTFHVLFYCLISTALLCSVPSGLCLSFMFSTFLSPVAIFKSALKVLFLQESVAEISSSSSHLQSFVEHFVIHAWRENHQSPMTIITTTCLFKVMPINFVYLETWNHDYVHPIGDGLLYMIGTSLCNTK